MSCHKCMYDWITKAIIFNFTLTLNQSSRSSPNIMYLRYEIITPVFFCRWNCWSLSNYEVVKNNVAILTFAIRGLDLCWLSWTLPFWLSFSPELMVGCWSLVVDRNDNTLTALTNYVELTFYPSLQYLKGI